tara:strand:+ start:12225 stop:14870 length:2646 start_codon:yes stop_codon:yes gene_type:complete
MSKIILNKKQGNDFLAISFGKPRYFNETDINVAVNWGDGNVENISGLTSAGVQRRTITFKVKVENRSGDKFVLYDEKGTTEISNPTLEEGNTYIFDQSDASNNTHPLVFSLTSEGTTHSTNVTISGTPGNDGTSTIVIQEGDTYPAGTLVAGLYIKCSSHPNMGTEVGKMETDQQSLTLWHLYNNKNARKIVVNGGFGTAVNAFDTSLKLCMAERGSRSPCANHEEIDEIGGNLWVHGEGDFEDMSIAQGKFNPEIHILDSADPSSTILKTAGDDGNIRCLYTFKGTKFRTSFRCKQFFANINSSSVSLISTKGCFQDSRFNMGGVNFGSALTDTSFMFKDSQWTNSMAINTQNVTTMESMFEGSKFNSGINGWNVGNVISMKNMFKNSKFNKVLAGWFTTAKSVQNMSGMFEAASFTGTIMSWNTSSVTDMSKMFKDNTVFQSSMLIWNTTNVTNMESMFEGSKVNPKINSWNVQGVTNAKNMFKNSQFNQVIGGWFKAGNALQNMEGMFEGSLYNKPINFWTNNVTNMSFLLKNNKVWNQAILVLNTANVTTLEGMFHGSVCNPGGLAGWNTSNVTTIKNMFNSSSFNKPLRWFQTAQNLLDMSGLLAGKSAFNHRTITSWDTSTVTNMSSLLEGNTTFTQDISFWDTSAVTDMSSMFNGCTAFNHSIRAWDVSKVKTMRNMFKNSIYNPAHSLDLNFWFNNRNSSGGNNPATFAIEDMSGMFENSAYNKILLYWTKHKATVKYAVRMFANNSSQVRTNVHNLFIGATLVEDVSAIFENSFDISGSQGPISRWTIFQSGSTEVKAAQINVHKGNTYRGNIGGYDYTAQEQTHNFEIPNFDTPDPVAPDEGGLDCLALYQGRPPADDSLNTIYFHIVVPT